MSDTRAGPRKRSFLAAYLQLGEGRAPQFCMVRDISTHGARLDTDHPDQLPDAFDLEINGRARRYRAEVIWRDETGAGIRFVAKAKLRQAAVARAG